VRYLDKLFSSTHYIIILPYNIYEVHRQRYFLVKTFFQDAAFLDKAWLNRRFHNNDPKSIKKPDELEKEMQEPPLDQIDQDILIRIQGSIIGMALGDALGAHVEFRPYAYMVQNPVTDLKAGGTWDLNKGQVLLLRLVLYKTEFKQTLRSFFSQ
jgi:hypothetical protein